MAPKGSKRKRSIQLSKARESKRRKSDNEESNLSEDLDDEIPTFSDYDSDKDKTFNPAMEKLDEDAAMEIHVEEWLSTLHRDDIYKVFNSLTSPTAGNSNADSSN